MQYIKRFLIPVSLLMIAQFLRLGINTWVTLTPETVSALAKIGEVLFVLSIAWAAIAGIRIAKTSWLKISIFQ